MWRVIEIGGEGYFLHVKHNSLIAEKDGSVVLSVHFSDIHSILSHSYGCVYSDNLMQKCMEHKIPIIFCNKKHLPTGMLLPMLQHTDASKRMEIQLEASVPAKKQAWQQIISEKLKNQCLLLDINGHDDASKAVLHLAQTVKSADSSNNESQGARIYFSNLFGSTFSRSSGEGDINACLDYGYTILRSAVARAVVECGLIPALGIFHSNKQNPYCLVDDLMEPFRPLVDKLVIDLFDKNPNTILDPSTKKTLIAITTYTISFKKQYQELAYGLRNYVLSYTSFLARRIKEISFPKFLL